MPWILALFSLLSLSAFASEDLALSMVPRSKVIENYGRDFILKTKAGTKIDIEFSRKGKLESASGKNLNKGDELEPGDGLIALSSAAHILYQNGKLTEGYWTLENDPELGWIYEIGDSTIEAQSGKIIKENALVSISESTSVGTSLKDHHTP